MVRFNVRTEDNEDTAPPDIFRAARNDDPLELALAIQSGQSLNDVEDRQSRMTPMHVACVQRSVRFLGAAVQLDFDPWIRDANGRLAFDHARAQKIPEIPKAIFEKMYPPGWADEAEVKPFPGS